MKSKLEPYIFLYSAFSNTFESAIVEAESKNIHSMQLRARLNTQRSLTVYGILATPLQVKTINKKLDDNLTNNTDLDIFNSLKNKIVNLGF